MDNTTTSAWAVAFTPEGFLEELIEWQESLRSRRDSLTPKDVGLLAEVTGRIADLKRQIGTH